MIKKIVGKSADLVCAASEALFLGLLYLLIKYLSPPETEEEASALAPGHETVRHVGGDGVIPFPVAFRRIPVSEPSSQWADEDFSGTPLGSGYCPYAWAN